MKISLKCNANQINANAVCKECENNGKEGNRIQSQFDETVYILFHFIVSHIIVMLWHLNCAHDACQSTRTPVSFEHYPLG